MQILMKIRFFHWDPDLWRIWIYDKKDPDHPSVSQNGKKIQIPDPGSQSRSSTKPNSILWLDEMPNPDTSPLVIKVSIHSNLRQFVGCLDGFVILHLISRNQKETGKSLGWNRFFFKHFSSWLINYFKGFSSTLLLLFSFLQPNLFSFFRAAQSIPLWGDPRTHPRTGWNGMDATVALVPSPVFRWEWERCCSPSIDAFYFVHHWNGGVSPQTCLIQLTPGSWQIFFPTWGRFLVSVSLSDPKLKIAESVNKTLQGWKKIGHASGDSVLYSNDVWSQTTPPPNPRDYTEELQESKLVPPRGIRGPCSKAREWDSWTANQPCMWFLHDGTG